MRDYTDIVNRAKNRKKEEEGNASSSRKSFDATSIVEKRQLGKKINLDTYESDLTSMNTRLSEVLGGWQTQETMQNLRSSVEDMYNRTTAYHDYASKYQPDAQTNLGEISNYYKQVLDSWDSIAGTYSKYSDADSYTKEMAKLKELASMSKEDVASNLNNKNQYAYTTLGGQDITWKSLYDEKEQAEFATSAKGKEGWEKYLADEAVKAQEAKEKEANKKWYDKVLENYSTYDTSNIGGLLAQTVADKRKDTSYQNPTDDWTEEEQNIFGAYYLENPEKAYEYATNLNNSKALAKKNEQKQGVADSATSGLLAGTGHTLASIASAPFAIADYLDDLTDLASGRPIIEESVLSPFEYSQAVQGGISTHLNEKHGTLNENIPVLGGKGWGDVYGAGTSIAQSTLNRVAFGPIGTLVSYFGQGASAGIDDVISRGGTDEQALLYGSTVGALEGALEALVGDKVSKIGASSTIGNFFAKLVAQGKSEAKEEGLTTIFSNIADGIIMKDKSAFANAVRTYKENGMSDGIAYLNAILDVGEDTLYDALVGFVSGVSQGGTQIVKSTHDLGKAIRENDTIGDLGSLASEVNGDAYKKYVDLIESGKINNLQLGSLHELVSSQTYSNYDTEKANIEMRAIANQANDLGDSKNSGIIASAIQKKVNGQKLSSEEKMALESDTAKAILDTGTVVKTSESFDNALKNIGKLESITTPKTIEEKAVASATKEANQQALENQTRVNEMVQAEGREDITFYSKSMEQAKAEAFNEIYDGKTDMESYANSFELAYTYGKAKIGVSEALKNKGVLTEAQVLKAYEAGNIGRVIEKQKIVDDINKKYSAKTFVKGKFDDSIIDYNGNDEGKVAWNSLTTKQKNAVNFARAFSEVTGVNISFITSKVINEETGQRSGENGRYDASTNTIYIDAYAGMDAGVFDDAIVPTISHEVTHWMKQKAPAMYQKMQDYILETLTMDGSKTLNEIIAKQKYDMKKHHPNMKVTDESAIDELVARGAEDMLANSDKVRKMLAKMSEAEQKSFIEKVKETFKNLIDWVNDLLKQYNSTSKEAEMLRQYKNRMKELSKMWDATLAEAIKTNQSMREAGLNDEFTEPKSNLESQFSMRYWDKMKDEQDDLLAKILSGQNGYEFETDMNEKTLNEAQKLVTDTIREINDRKLKNNMMIFPTEVLGRVMSKNLSYGVSIDGTRICFRTVTFNHFNDMVQEIVGRPLNANEQLVVNEKLVVIAKEPQCLVCYVALDRKAYWEDVLWYMDVRDKYIGLWNKTNKTEEDFQKLYNKFLREKVDSIAEKYRRKLENADENNVAYSSILKQFLDEPLKGDDLKHQKRLKKTWDGSTKTEEEAKDILSSYANTWHPTAKKKPTTEMETRLRSWFSWADSGVPLLQRNDLTTEDKLADLFNQTVKKGRDSIQSKAGKTYADGDIATQYFDLNKYAQSASWAKKADMSEDVLSEDEETFGRPIDQSLAKYQTVLTYWNDIRKLKPSDVFRLNHEYGLRFYSYSEFNGAFLVDNMQEFIDASLVGLKALMYSKSYEGARFFAPSGANINVGVIIEEDEKGGYRVSKEQSTPTSLDNLIKLREQYPNVGIIAVATTKDMAIWSAKQPWTDVVIPFHTVRNSYGVSEMGWQDHKTEQEDKKPSKKNVQAQELWKAFVQETQSKELGTKEPTASIMPFEHENDYATYRELCAKRGVTPRFTSYLPENSGLTEHEYMKFVVETRRKASETPIVKPVFQENVITEILDEFEKGGGYRAQYTIPDSEVESHAKEVANDILKGKTAMDVEYGSERTKEIAKKRMSGEINSDNVPRVHGQSMVAQYSDRDSDLWGDDDIDSWLYDFLFGDDQTDNNLLDDDIEDIDTILEDYENSKQPKQRAKRRVDEVKKRLDALGLSFNGTKTLAWTDERIEKYVSDGWYGSSNPNYAQAYVTYMTPQQYLNLTAGSRTITLDVIEKESAGYGELDLEKLGKTNIPIMLEIDESKGKVTSHEGRHRMYLLGKAGFEKVPVLLFDSRTEYGKKTAKDSLKLKPQRFYDEDFISKTRDTVVYDLVPLSSGNKDLIIQKFGSGVEADVYYSDRDYTSVYELMGEKETLDEENRKLKADIEKLKATIGSEEVNITRFRSLADYLKKQAGSNYSREALGDALKELYNYIQTTDDLKWYNVMAKAEEIANDMMQLNVPINYFREVMNDIRQDKVSLSEEQYAEAVKLYGSYGNLHRALFGSVNLTKSGRSLEEQWKDWSKAFPTVFKADISAVDMVKELRDIVDALKSTSAVMGEYERQEAIRHMGMEIYNQFWNIASDSSEAVRKERVAHRQMMEQMRKDYEERQKEKSLHPVGEVALKYEKLLKDTIKKDRAEMKRIRELGKKRIEEQNERAEARATIQRITKNALTMSEWYATNGNDKHIPDSMKGAVKQLIDSINFSSKQLLGIGGKLENRYQPTKNDLRLEKALSRLYEASEEIKNSRKDENGNEVLFLDFDIPDVSVLKDMSKKSLVLNQMSLEDLKALDKVVAGVKKAVITANRNFKIAQDETRERISNRLIYDARLLSEKKMDNIATNFFEYQNTTPYYMLKRLGTVGEQIFNALMDAQEEFVFLEDEISKYVEKTVGGSKKESAEKIRQWSEEIHEITILDAKRSTKENPKYKTIKMTTAQIMSFYCLSKRDTARVHLEGGGIRITNIKDGILKVIRDTEGSSLSKSDISKIIGELTDEQKKVADTLQKFMSETGGKWGNKVTKARWDIEQFGEEFYFPMATVAQDKNLDSIGKKDNSIYRLLNLSFTKALTPKANNQLVIDNIFDVFADHMTDMAKYSTFALPLLDTMKILSYSRKDQVDLGEDESGNRHETTSASQEIIRAFGENGYRYIIELLKDLNGVEVTPRDEIIPKTMMANYKISAVGGNLRVALLQGSAYVKAGLVMDSKYLIKALGTNGLEGSKKAMENSGIALWKSKGHYDLNISRSVIQEIKQDKSKLDKFREFSLKGAEWGDKITWGYLWNACELWAKENTPYSYNSAEFNKAVAGKLREIIVKTQVVDSTLTRSQMMRDKSAMVQTLTAFMSESTMTYNMLSDAFFEWSLDARKEGHSYKSTFKDHGRKFATTAGVFALQAFATALAGGFVDAVRDDDEDEKFGEKYIEHLLEALGDNINPIANLPIFKDIISIAQGYSPSRFDEQSFVNLFSGIKQWMKVVEGDGNVYKATYKTLQGLSQLTGLPVSNMMRDVVAMWNSTIGEMYPNLKIEQ